MGEALESVLRQDCGPFELIIADDASTDGTAQAIDRVLASRGQGHIKVIRLSRGANLGLIGNFNAAMERATGDIVVSCAGDDISEPGRFSALAGLFVDPSVQLVCSAYTLIDEKGEPLGQQHDDSPWRRGPFAYGNFSRNIYASAPVCGATAAFRRSLHERFGPLSQGTHGEDNAMWVRALLVGSIAAHPRRLVRWRQHAQNMSNFTKDIGDIAASRSRRLAFIDKHARMAPQWLRDIRLAESSGLLSRPRATQLEALAEAECLHWLAWHIVLGGGPAKGGWWRLLRHLFMSRRAKLAWRLIRYTLFPWKRERQWVRLGLGRTR